MYKQSNSKCSFTTDSTTPAIASMDDQRRDFYYIIVMQLPIIKFNGKDIFVRICESKYCCIPNGKQAVQFEL